MRLAIALLAATLLTVGIAGAQEVAPLRIGLVEAPNAGVTFVSRGPDGAPRGVTADLGTELARALGRPAAFTVFPNSGAATDATHAGAVDVTFVPVDEVRRQLVDFGPAYYQLESTYLVSGASGITEVAQVDRAGLRVVAINGTTTLRASARTLTVTQPVPVASVAEAVALMQGGGADALALSRDSLAAVALQVPGSRIVAGGFQQTTVSVAVPKGQGQLLAAVSQWLSAAKASGLVRRVFDANGLRVEAVAP